jgi:hypothetical protein
VAEAGWQPVTHAQCDNPKIWVERFGPKTEGEILITLFNDTPQPQQGKLQVETAALRLTSNLTARELVSGVLCAGKREGFQIQLQPGEAKVFEIKMEQ